MYFTGDDWKIVADFLDSLHKDTPEGEYHLKGKEIFARVMSYNTRQINEARLEGHRTYIDIQAVIDGAEGIAWHHTADLETHETYDTEKDVEFFHPPAHFSARIDVLPGYFVALFPHDAHMPQLQVTGMPPLVKKVVVKVDVSLYSDICLKGQ